MFNIIGTGGGGSLLGNITRNGGASNFLYGFNFPYNCEQIDKILGFKPQEYCSARMSQHLAWAAFKQNKFGTGLGFCCSLKKEGEREDRKHKAFATIQQESWWTTFEIPLIHDSRPDQEHMVSMALQDILRGDCSHSIAEDVFNFDYRYLASNNTTNSLFANHLIPGSFNPIHKGHQAIIDYVYNKEIIPSIEISMSNADKPNISFMEIQDRFIKIKELYPDIGLVITDMPKFYHKCEEADLTFYLGSDTYNRIINIKYYDSIKDMLKKLKYIASTNKLNVFSRPGHPVNRDTFLEMILRPNFIDIETPNISSTEIRNGLVC